MKPWIPLLAGLSVSGAVLLALWLEEPPPPLELDLPEAAAPLPPPPLPLVRAAVAPSLAPPPQASQVPGLVPQPVPEEEVPPQLGDPEVSPRPGSPDFPASPAQRVQRAERLAQMMAGRNQKLKDELNSAIASGDRETEARIRPLVEAAEARMERARLQVERMRQRAEAERR